MTATENPKQSGKERRAIAAGRAKLVNGAVVAAPPPRWSVGDVVTTRYTVAVPRAFGRRRWLFLLPGCRWQVTGVGNADRIDKRPTYQLRCVGERYEITRAEYRLRPAGGV